MKMMVGQAMIDVILNAYMRHPAFDLSNEDIVGFLDHFIYTVGAVLDLIKEDVK